MRRRVGLAVLGLSSLLVRAAVAASAPPLAGTETPGPLAVHLLAEAREATGGAAWDGARFAHVTAKLVAGGQPSRRECWLDVKATRAACVTDDGPEAGRWGSDGATQWFADVEGAPQSLADAHLVPALEAWWRAAGWSRPLGPGQSATWRGEERLSGRLAERIAMTLPAGSFDLWLDRANHLPLKLAIPVEGGQRVIRLSGWRHKDEFALPRHIEISAPGQPTTVETVQGMDLNHPIDAVHFARPTERIADFQFPGDASSVSLPLKLANGHLFIDLRVGIQNEGETKQDGAKHRPTALTLLFKLDTTSSALIDRAAALRLNLIDRADAPLGSIVRPHDFRIGGIAFRHFGLRLADLQPMTAGEGILAPASHAGGAADASEIAPIDGVIGADLVRRLIVEFDREGGRVVFFKPKGFIAPKAANPIPLTLSNGLALIDGRIDGIATELAIDSGSAASLVLPQTFAEAHHLEKRWHPVPAVADAGDTADQVLESEAASLELGVYGIARPIAQLRDLADPTPRIGGQVLRRFDMILDGPGGRLWLQQNGSFDQPDSRDGSGVALVATGHGIMIAHVLPNSPAAHAHVEAGEELVSIGTSQANTLGLSAIRERLAGLYGPTVSLGLLHAGQKKVEYVRLPLTAVPAPQGASASGQ